MVLVVVYFLANAVMSSLLPLSNDIIAALTPEDRARYFPLLLVNIAINMTVMFLVLQNVRYRGWKLVFGTCVTFWGIFTVLNAIELYWYNESFPLLSYLDVTKMIINALVAYSLTALAGTWLVGGVKRDAKPKSARLATGRFGWRIGVFCVAYALFYYACGFITRLFPAAREFYAGWAATMEPIPILLLFNIFRGALWLTFSLPILLGAKTRKQALWLTPIVLVTGTAVSLLTPSALMPGGVRVAHFVELGISMTAVGLFMVWFLRAENSTPGERPASAGGN
jgi:hypothetical protein